MDKKRIVILLVASLLLLPSSALAATLEGTVQGYHCAAFGKACPKDMMDPIVGAERTFVVVPKGSDKFYLVPNLDRAVLARHLLENIRITGTIDKKYNSIMAKTLEVREKGEWKLKWSMEIEDKMLKELHETP